LPVFSAGVPLRDPGIPDNERLVYKVTDEGRPAFNYEETVRLLDEGGVKKYEVTTHSREFDQVLHIRQGDFTVTDIRTVHTYNGAAVERSSALRENAAPLKDNEIGLLDYQAMTAAMRGFPFGSRTEAALVVLGYENAMGMIVKVKGTETVKAGGRDILCYRVELGISGFFGKLLPKTRFWYAAPAPHYLVRFEGSKAGPGSPVRTMELTEYSTGQK
jgi:hypothetical protein